MPDSRLSAQIQLVRGTALQQEQRGAEALSALEQAAAAFKQANSLEELVATYGELAVVQTHVEELIAAGKFKDGEDYILEMIGQRPNWTELSQLLARVMQAAATDGMANIGSMELFLSDPLRQKLELSCLPKVTADARDRATALLSGIGASLGDVLTVNTGETPVPGPRPLFAPMAMARAVAAPEPDLSAGPQTINVTATVTFAIAAPHK